MKHLRGSRHWIWEMDVYPDVAVELGWIKRGSLVERLIGVLTDWPRRHTDGVVVLGECMKDRLSARGVELSKLFVAENWADGNEIMPALFPASERLQVLYSGNLGLAHDIATVEQAMLDMDAAPVVDFTFVGGGPKRKELESRCKEVGLRHVQFRGYVDAAQLGASLSMGDIGLVTQKAECYGTVVPSKVYGLLASGRPILYIGPRGSTPERIINKFRCGWHIEPGDVEGLKNLLYTLAMNRRFVYEAGKNARHAFNQNYDLPIGVARVADAIGAREIAHDSLQLDTARALSYSPDR
jgi:glycosyltransferase involved in cell wall biosynthesis